MELVEADAFASRRAVQFDGERDQPEGKMPFPNSRRHDCNLERLDLMCLDIKRWRRLSILAQTFYGCFVVWDVGQAPCFISTCLDRKSTRLNSSHLGISYA